MGEFDIRNRKFDTCRERTSIEACMANEPRATNGSPVIRGKKLLESIINYAKVIDTT
jgi:hypothetical protein